MVPIAPAVTLALVIEDDDRVAEMIAVQLRTDGFEVMRAAAPEEGLVPKAGFNGDLEQPIRYNALVASVAAMQAGRNE